MGRTEMVCLFYNLFFTGWHRWYCMPEKGDSVRLYFPNENEAEAYVNSSVNEQSSNSSARSNPDEKSIKNKQGKEVLFQPDRLILK